VKSDAKADYSWYMTINKSVKVWLAFISI